MRTRISVSLRVLLNFMFITSSMNWVLAQYVFSQFWMRDMRLNPALTGLMPSKWKAGYDIRFFRDDSLKSNWSNTYIEFKKSFYKRVGQYASDKEPTGWTLGYGFLDDRRRGNFDKAYFIADYISLALQKIPKKLERQNRLFALGMQIGLLRDGKHTLFDLNLGLLWGKNTIMCWQEDQMYQYQWGISAYHVFLPWRAKTDYAMGRTVHAHASALVKYNKHVHLVLQAFGGYSNQPDFMLGGYAILYPDVHYYYWDRFRLGAHYRLTNHLVVSSGLRLYGKPKKSVAIDLMISYDLPMKFLDLVSPYKHAWEVGFYIYPHEKCWNISPCAML